MAGGIDGLYQKYCNRIQRNLENDSYYQYLLELIAGSKTTVTQYNRVLDKTVDEHWLTAIEEALPTIHEIIAHPRKFVKAVETLAPVEQVKKVSSDTVRHLASHTQFINGMRAGSIYPAKLLTVTNEESADLYENRFVHTLILKLSQFIEKRTDALFWDTENEQASRLAMEAKVEDDYEIIEYKLDMTVKSKQTYMQNDNDKMDVFKRIDRVRRIVADFRQSTFVAMMSDTPLVHSPIQRTNQITKNPEYRKCYNLWQFLEHYDQVGYQIDVRETALDFDEDYLFQMYGNLALNYTVFKSLLDKDPRRITDTPRRRKTIKPKFVKEIIEEFVEDYDIPDVEIRRVIVEEVTKAQLEIQRRTKEYQDALASGAPLPQLEKTVKKTEKELEKAKLAAQKAKELEKAKLQKQKEQEKAKLAAQKAKEREKAKLQKQKEQEKLAAQKAKEREKAKLQKQKEQEKLAAQKAKEREKAKLQKQKEQEQEKLAAQKAKEREKARLQKQKEQEQEKLAAQKAKERERAKLQKQKEQEQEKAKPAAPKPKAPAKPKPKPVIIQEPEPEPEPVIIPEPEPVIVPEPEPVAVPEPEPEPAEKPSTNPLMNWIARRKGGRKSN